jgi:hypothetical protein
VATYLELTNSAVIESGIEADELTSSNFATTSDPLLRRMKRWVSQAYKEITMERNEWTWKSKKAQIVIYPRFLVIDGNRAADPPVDSKFEGDDTGTTFTVVDSTILSGSWAGGDAVAYLDYLDLSGAVSFNELFDETDPNPANLDVFRVKWFGRYDLESEVTDLLEPNFSSFYVQGASGLTDTTLNTGDTDLQRLQYVPWDLWNSQYEYQQDWGKPSCFTKTPDGEYDVYPRPNTPYILTFNYTAEPATLTDWDDTVDDLPPLYQDMIVWRAVMYYADYDRKPDMFARAERRYEYYKNRAEKNLMPTPSFGFNRYSTTNRFW